MDPRKIPNIDWVPDIVWGYPRHRKTPEPESSPGAGDSIYTVSGYLFKGPFLYSAKKVLIAFANFVAFVFSAI